MRRERSLLVVNNDNIISKIIKSLKKFLGINQEEVKEEINRTAPIIKEEKIERKIRKNFTLEDLESIESNVSNNIDYIDNLDEDALESLDEYYDIRINELETILNDKKSGYYKLVSASRMKEL